MNGWTEGFTQVGVIDEWAFPADPDPAHPFFTGPAIIDGQVLPIAKGFIDSNGPTGRMMSDDAHCISEDRLDCHAIPVLAVCQKGSTEREREAIVISAIARHIKAYFAGTIIFDGPSRTWEGVTDPMGFAFGGPYGAILKFESETRFQYDLVTFELWPGGDNETLEESLVPTRFGHKIIHEY
jgi:hypothetical protein